MTIFKIDLMKTKFLNYILLSFVTLAFVSCQNDDDALPPQSQAQFTANPTEAKVGQDIQFTNNSQNATAYLWSFGDGTTSNQVSPRKSYQSSDVFLVSLVSTGAGGSTISNMEVTVTPASAFTVADVDNLTAKIAVLFTNTSLGAASYSWSFGDANNSTSTDQNPSFTYPLAGTFTVSLTATSSAGSNTFTKEVIIAAAPEVPGELYYIDLTDDFIRKLSLDGSGTITDVVDLVGKGGVGIAYDATNEKIYFSDFDTYPFGNIWRVNRDGTALEVVVTNIGDPYSIALDVAANKMYWVDDEGNVSRANLDGTSPEIGILNIPDASWRALALDVENGKMYAYDANVEDLYVANLDGSNPQIIISEVYGYAMAIDTVNDKIYFDERNSGELKVANLDGTNIQTIETSSSRIFGIHVDSATSKLYWSIRDTGELYRADLDGSNKEVLKSGLGSVRGIVLIK
jgi:PKD repeat protein